MIYLTILGGVLAIISLILIAAGISMFVTDCGSAKSDKLTSEIRDELKFDLFYLMISIVFFVISFLGYLIPTKYYKNEIKQCLKEKYDNVYEYKYSYILNDGCFLYDNKKYSIKIIKDIDNNNYVQVIKDENNDTDTLNLPLK